MRMPRLKPQGRPVLYHCFSHIAGDQALLRDREKEVFRQMMWRQAAFSQVEVDTYCVMGNHFHLVVRVPARVELSDEGLVGVVERHYGVEDGRARGLRELLKQQGFLSEEQRAPWLRRMGDVSVFLQELKQGFSRWYNRVHERRGTLWSGRFESVLVEDVVSVRMVVAGYVDLNPVRAGMVEDAKDYRWSGYGEAMGGGEGARAGLERCVGVGGWEEAGAAYREVLLLKSGVSGHSGKVAVDGERLRKKVRDGVRLSLGEVLRLRVRYFTDGLVLGSANWVNEVFVEYRERFGARRRSGARRLRVGGLEGLRAMRDLRKRVVG